MFTEIFPLASDPRQAHEWASDLLLARGRRAGSRAASHGPDLTQLNLVAAVQSGSTIVKFTTALGTDAPADTVNRRCELV
jgi:hypothetical protein